MKDNSFGVVDINFLAHLPTVRGQAVSLESLLLTTRSDGMDSSPTSCEISCAKRHSLSTSGTTSSRASLFCGPSAQPTDECLQNLFCQEHHPLRKWLWMLCHYEHCTEPTCVLLSSVLNRTDIPFSFRSRPRQGLHLCPRIRGSSRTRCLVWCSRMVQGGESHITFVAVASSDGTATPELPRDAPFRTPPPRRCSQGWQAPEEVWQHPPSMYVPLSLASDSSTDVASIAAAEDEGRPIYLLKASLPKIKLFVASRIPPINPIPVALPVAVVQQDIEMR
jgi:hypothetical protein